MPRRPIWLYIVRVFLKNPNYFLLPCLAVSISRKPTFFFLPCYCLAAREVDFKVVRKLILALRILFKMSLPVTEEGCISSVPGVVDLEGQSPVSV